MKLYLINRFSFLSLYRRVAADKFVKKKKREKLTLFAPRTEIIRLRHRGGGPLRAREILSPDITLSSET